jgi:hypothetical protein
MFVGDAARNRSLVAEERERERERECDRLACEREAYRTLVVVVIDRTAFARETLVGVV